jgi:hypothetical protein
MPGCPRHGKSGIVANSAGGQRARACAHGDAKAIRHLDANALRHLNANAIRHGFANSKGDSPEAGSRIDHAARRKR